jgi:hypothetical protein
MVALRILYSVTVIIIRKFVQEVMFLTCILEVTTLNLNKTEDYNGSSHFLQISVGYCLHYMTASFYILLNLLFTVV